MISKVPPDCTLGLAFGSFEFDSFLEKHNKIARPKSVPLRDEELL